MNASELLNNGEVVAVPTETVYGLAASLKHPKAIEKIYLLKGRPANNPLIIHVSSVRDVVPFVKQLPPEFESLTAAFWPGPLTLVVPIISETIPTVARAGLQTAAFRAPKHPLAQEVIAKTGPLVMPSANLSGKPSATTAEHVKEDFGADFPVLDGGPCVQGMESTVMRYHENQWEIIRLGCIAAEEIEIVLGYVPRYTQGDGKKPACPGQLYRHYAPKAKLHLTRHFSKNMKTIIGYEGRVYPEGSRTFILGENIKEILANLYATLRRLDQEGIQEAWVDLNVSDGGQWVTLVERLTKASNNN